MQPGFDDIPRPSVWRRLLIGAALIVFAAAGATAVAAFREVDKVVNALKTNDDIAGLDEILEETDPGNPQTILLLGSDRRPKNATDGGAGSGARSDTVILVRLNPDEGSTALLSLPRDLKVQIPGHGIGKLNSAYEYGGPKLTLKTVKLVTGLNINHVVNVDFAGFRRAINALGCVYADVDRRYYNDSAEYAYINVQPGYQKMCGDRALQYARFRHEDSDLVRSARQQDLLGQVKQQVGVGKIVDDRDKLLRIFGKHTTSDRGLKSRGEVLRLLKLAVGTVGNPIREVAFDPGKIAITSGDAAAGVPSYVEASNRYIKSLAQRFLKGEQTPGPRGQLLPKGKRRKKRAPSDGGLEKAGSLGMDQAVQAIGQGAGKHLPVYFPTVRLKNSVFAGPPRFYKLLTPDGKRKKSYRMVLKRHLVGEYYGVQGTTWKNPPILDSPSEEKKMGSRTFDVHYDGDRIRLVAWRTSKAVYWVSNTLLRTLSNRSMLTIARTTRLP